MSETEFLIGHRGLTLEPNFYPEGLPKTWRLDYYSTQFQAVVLPIFGGLNQRDLAQIFADLEDEDDFELVLSIAQTDLNDADKLTQILAQVANYRRQFTLWAQVDVAPAPEILAQLEGYRLCFQSAQQLDFHPLNLREKSAAGQVLSFNQRAIFVANALPSIQNLSQNSVKNTAQNSKKNPEKNTAQTSQNNASVVVGNEAKIRTYLEQIAQINTPTVLIFPDLISRDLRAIRTISELLGF